MNRQSEAHCDVLVVGAGPTGLMVANLLARSGVNVRIVERRLEASRESRAFAVQARTLELMHSIGLANTFLDRGVIATGIDIHVRGKRRGGLNLDRANSPDTPYQFILMIPQSQTEAILIEDLLKLGITVERGIEVTGLQQNEDGVTTSIRQPDGTTQQIVSRYVVGADGSRSAVRAGAGLRWEGDSYPQRFLLADCKVDWELDHNRFRVFINGPRIGLFLPLKGKQTSRIMATDLSLSAGDGDASVPEPLELEEMLAGFKAAIGIPVKLSNPVWVTRYRAHHRAVDRYSNGRVFVAGDAAHIHSPAGGQGMNTGLQDGSNLAWKLALALKTQCDDELLESYDCERRPVGELVVRSTGKLFASAAGQAGWKANLRDFLAMTFLPLISHLPPFHKKAFFNTSQRAIAYPPNRYICEGPRWPKHGPKAGQRAPNATISNTFDVFSLLTGYRFAIIAFSREPLAGDESKLLADRLKGLADSLANARSHLIARSDCGRFDHANCSTTGEVFERYGLTGDCDQALYVIRPDGYVAWRCMGLDFAACEQFLGQFTNATSPALEVGGVQ